MSGLSLFYALRAPLPLHFGLCAHARSRAKNFPCYLGHQVAPLSPRLQATTDLWNSSIRTIEDVKFCFIHDFEEGLGLFAGSGLRRLFSDRLLFITSQETSPHDLDIIGLDILELTKLQRSSRSCVPIWLSAPPCRRQLIHHNLGLQALTT